MIIVRLSKRSDHNDTYDLKFDFEDNTFVPKWIDRYKAAEQRGDPISEPNAFYNLNDDWDEKRVLADINYHISKMSSLFGGVKLTSLSNQEELNFIHNVFAQNHGKLDEWQGSLEKRDQENLSAINQLVHRAEGFGGPKKIRVVWFDLPKTETYANDDYELFTDHRVFGGVYVLYADVGKNLESLAIDNDAQHHGDFVPNLHYSADFFISFSDRVEDTALYRQYYDTNKSLFDEQGYVDNDPRLTTGFLKIAQLRYENKDEVLSNLAQYDHIQSVYVL